MKIQKYLVMLAVLAPVAGRADQYCGNLLAYAERALGASGACAPEGGSLLSPAGCDRAVPVPAEAAAYLAELERSFALQCQERSAQSYRQLASPLIARLSFLPVPEGGMGFWCKGWKGAAFALRAGPSAAAPVLAQIAPGADFNITDDMESDWSFVWNEKGAMGWTLTPPESFGHCDSFAG